MTTTCLVTGATGAVGPRLVEALLEAGCAVTTLSRDDAAAAAPGGEPTRSGAGSGATPLRRFRAEIDDEAALARAIDGIDVVFHLAAFLHVTEPRPEHEATSRRVNVDGTRRVVDAAQRAGAARVVFFSTIAVYGYAQHRRFDEESPCRPDTLYAKTKLEAERIVLDARRADGQPLGTVLRLAAVYGPGVKGNYERLVRAIARGRFVGVGPGHNRRALVHDRDVAAAALLASGHASAAGRVFNVGDGQEHRLCDIIAAVARATGRPAPRLHVPLWLARSGIVTVESAARSFGRRPPVSRATLDKYLEDVVVDTSRIQQELGFVPRVGLDEGWRDTVAGVRARGLIG